MIARQQQVNVAEARLAELQAKREQPRKQALEVGETIEPLKDLLRRARSDAQPGAEMLETANRNVELAVRAAQTARQGVQFGRGLIWALDTKNLIKTHGFLFKTSGTDSFQLNHSQNLTNNQRVCL